MSDKGEGSTWGDVEGCDAFEAREEQPNWAKLGQLRQKAIDARAKGELDADMLAKLLKTAREYVPSDQPELLERVSADLREIAGK